MRTILFIGSFLLVLAKAEAQLVLQQDWLIKAGFEMTLYSNSYNDVNGNLNKSGSNQRWAFSNLGVDDTIRLEARPAAQGMASANFPTADLVFTSGSDIGLIGANSEIYMRQNNDDLLVLGFANTGANNMLPVAKLTDPLTFQSTPVAFGGSGGDQTRLRLAFSSSFLGDSTLAQFTDSLAVNLGQDIAYTVDGWGQINLNNNFFDALRVTSVTESFQTFEIKLPFLGWVDAALFLPDSLADLDAQLRVEDVSWLVAEYSYPIVKVTLGIGGAPDRVEYASDAVSGALEQREAPVRLAVVQRGQELRIETSSKLTGTGSLRVYSSDGRELGASSVALNEGSASLDVSNWPAGVSLVALLSENTSLLATQRILLVP